MKRNKPSLISRMKANLPNVKIREIIAFAIGIFACWLVSYVIGENNIILNNVSGILGIVTTFLAYKAWAEAKAIREDKDRIRKRIIENEEVEQIALVIQVEKSEIYGNVKPYIESANNRIEFLMRNDLKNGERLRSLCDDQVSVKVEKSVVILTVPRMPEKSNDCDDYFIMYSRYLNEILQEIKNGGISIVHLFVGIPIAMGVFTGTRLRNNFTVIGYHYLRDASSSDMKYCRAFDRTFESYLSEN